MKNKEKYIDEIVKMACHGQKMAMDKQTGRLLPCTGKFLCHDCSFGGTGKNCDEAALEWANTECSAGNSGNSILDEDLRISRKDRDFLDYVGDAYIYITRAMGGDLYLHKSKPTKGTECWEAKETPFIISGYKVEFPMVTWKDDNFWFIDELKTMELCENY